MLSRPAEARHKVKIRGSGVIPSKATVGSLGYDLAINEHMVILPGATEIAPTGIYLAEDLPYGVGMFILPRSSLFLKYSLLIVNSPGLIDKDYSGEIGIILYNVGDQLVRLKKGTRVAQIVFPKLFEIDVVETENNEDRNRVGFGSTGE